MRLAVCAFHIKNKLQKLSSGRCGAVVIFQPTMRYADAFTVFL
jgi:hypothetical protein